MYSKETTVINATGLHARPASEFVKAAARFKSQIRIRKVETGKEANAKSILFLLSMGLTQGTKVELIAEGADEKTAVDSLVELIEGGLGE